MLRCCDPDQTLRLTLPSRWSLRTSPLRARALRFAARMLARVIDGAAWVGSRVPVWLSHALARIGGNLLWATRPKRRRRLAFNVCHAVAAELDDPQVRRLVRRVMVNESHAAADLLWSLGRPQEFLDTVVYENWDRVDEIAREGRGLLLAGTHIGGWEVATAIPGAKLPIPTSVIVADNWIAWAIEHARTAAGLQVMYRDVAALRSVRRLQAGEAVLLLGDNSEFARHTHRVRFLDSQAELAAGVVALARLAGSPIVPFTVLPVGPRRWRAAMGRPIEPPPPHLGRDGEQPVLQQLADRWSEAIMANPEHWSLATPIHWIGQQDGPEPGYQDGSGSEPPVTPG